MLLLRRFLRACAGAGVLPALFALGTLGGCHAPHSELPPPASAPPSAAPALDASALNDAVRRGVTAGVVAGVSRGADVRLEAFGLADLDAKRPTQPNDVFRFASMTKTFTAVAILQLVERGLLPLDEPLSKVLPAYATAYGRVTVRQLLEHTSGIPDFTESPRFAALERADLTPEQCLELVEDQPLRFAPGSRFAYSNTGYLLLGMIVERLGGERFGDYLTAHVFAPSAMTRTAMCSELPSGWSVAHGYAPRDGRLTPATPIGVRTPFSAGGLCGTAGDLLRFWSALSHGKLVTLETYRAMQRAAPMPDGTPAGYGLGLGFGSVGARRLVEHEGGIAGFTTVMVRDDDADVTVVVLCNTEDVPVSLLGKRLLRAALGLALPAASPAPPEVTTAAVGDYVLLGTVPVVIEASPSLALRVGRRPPAPLRWEAGRVLCLEADCDALKVTVLPTSGGGSGILLEKDGVSLGALRRSP